MIGPVHRSGSDVGQALLGPSSLNLAGACVAPAPFRVLDLFSGIGGFSLGLERTGGFQTIAFCEIEPFCRRVLNKHWPEVPVYEDVRQLTADRLAADGIAVDVICGGFPCQDISKAGKGAGITGERSGLWSEYARLIGELRPRYVIVENVALLRSRGLDKVLGDLAALGFHAEWHCIPASAIGAPHRRDRIWVVAHPHDQGQPQQARRQQTFWLGLILGSEDVADANFQRLEGRRFDRACASEWSSGEGSRSVPGDWSPEPDVGRVAHGVPSRMDRLRSLGNAVVPQVVEAIGRAILTAELSLSDLGTPSLDPRQEIAGEAADVDPIAAHETPSLRPQNGGGDFRAVQKSIEEKASV